MYNAMKATVFAIPVLISGCTTQPLPGALTGATTAQIVRKIRCEAKDAVLSAAATYRQGHAPPAGVDAETYFGPYSQAVLAYDFTFDITASADNGAKIDFSNPFSNGARAFGLGGGVNRQSQNVRNFRVADTFEELMAIQPVYCMQRSEARSEKEMKVSIQPEKWLYPITGEVGIGEEIDTFMELNQTAKLLNKEGSPVPTFADTREFLTILSGSVSPSIELKAVSNGVGISKASFINTVKRTDKHTLGIVLTLPTPKASSGNKRKENEGETKTRAINELIFQKTQIFQNDLKNVTRGLTAE